MKTAVFFSHFPIFYSIYVIDFVDSLAKKGFSVDLFLQNSGEKIPKFTSMVSVINLPKEINFDRENINDNKYSYKNYIPKANDETIKAFCEKNQYDYCIGIESAGLFLAKAASEYCSCPYSLFNFELYDYDNPGVWGKDIFRIKELEKSLLPELDLFIIQDEDRYEAYCKAIKVTERPKDVLYFPVSLSKHDLTKVNKNIWREKFKLPEYFKTVLYFGQLNVNRYNEEMVSACQQLPRDTALILKGITYGNLEYVYKLKALDKMNKTLFDIEEIAWNDRIERVASSNIGLLYYRSHVVNDFLTGKSSDKLAAYMQAGIPCICPDYPSFKKVINKYSNGIAVSSIDKIPMAVNEIFADYKDYALGASKAFEEVYNLDVYIDELSRHIMSRKKNILPQTESLFAMFEPLVELESNETQADNSVRISFIMIVLNGMPFVIPALESIYEFAHEIIIIEGAVDSCLFAANDDGSSNDGTIEAVKNFPDPLNKIKFEQGKWTEKVDMHNKALKYVSGNYVWLVDSDEVYHKNSIEKTIDLINNDNSITQINFIPDNFWKGFDNIFISDKFFEPDYHYRRVFKFEKGAEFISHRPPQLRYLNGNLSENGKVISGTDTCNMGIIPMHYSYVYDFQVQQKIELYKRYNWGSSWGIDLDDWYLRVYTDWTNENKSQIESIWGPWTGDKNSFTKPFTGKHPESMQNIIKDHNSILKLKNALSSVNVLSKSLTALIHIEEDQLSKAVVENLKNKIKNNNKYFDGFTALSILPAVLESKEFLDIGAGRGLSFAQTVFNSKLNNAAALDSWSESYSEMINTKDIFIDRIQQFASSAGKQFAFTALKGNSQSELAKLLSSNKKFDLINIDSSIKQDEAWIELKSAADLLDSKGVIIFNNTKVNNLIDLVYRLSSIYTEFNVLVNNSDGRGTALFFKNIGFDEIVLKISHRKNIKVASDYQTNKDLTAVNENSEFQKALEEIFTKYRPIKIIETGTYLGQGTTSIIASQIRDLKIENAEFYTIEINSNYLSKAILNLTQAGLLQYVKTLHGLSVPKDLLPTLQEIENATVTNIEYDNIFIDHRENERAYLYFRETDFNDIKEDTLGRCIDLFDGKPDFVLLDSGGHLGFAEFEYLLSMLEGDCIIALDDIYHIKHHKSYLQIKNDSRFEILYESKEKFGFCIAKYNYENINQDIDEDSIDYSNNIPVNAGKISAISIDTKNIETKSINIEHHELGELVSENEAVKQTDDIKPLGNEKQESVQEIKETEPLTIFWSRPDSIGDNILAMPMLKAIKSTYPLSKLVIAVKESVAELYDNNPYCDAILTIDRDHFLINEPYRNNLIAQIADIKADIAINSVYSRDSTSDYLVFSSKAKEIIGFYGDTSNITEKTKSLHNEYYTKLIETSKDSEIERNIDFADQCGFDTKDWKLELYTNPEDSQFAEELFNELNFKSEDTICLFAGAQYDVRIYEHYGKAIETAFEDNINIIALGSKDDFEINELNLADCPSFDKINLSGKLTLNQTIEIMSRCSMAVGAETGLAHIACALDMPNAVVLGGGHFPRFMPYSPKTICVTMPMNCFNCNWNCKHDEAYCVKNINPDILACAVSDARKRHEEKPAVYIQSEPYGNAPGFVLDINQLEELKHKYQIILFDKKTDDISTSNEIENEILVSAIVSVYKAQAFIRDCLDDLTSQILFKIGKMEIIIIDSNSPENEAEIIKEFTEKSSNIIYVRTAERETVYKAWNRALKIARGQYITNANSDDRHREDFMTILSDYLNSHNDTAVVYADQYVTPNSNETFDNTQAEHIWNWPLFTYELLEKGCIVGPQPMWRKILHEKYGYFREDLITAGDYEFWLRIGKTEKIEKIDQVLGVYFLNPNSLEHGTDTSPKETAFVRSLYKIVQEGFEPREILPLRIQRADEMISVIIPCYNHGIFLKEAVASVINQTYKNLEIIIIDDASTDNSAFIAEEIINNNPAYKIKLIKFDKNCGQAKARNSAIRIAKGKYILPLDADDIIMPEMIKKCYDAIRLNNNISIAYTDVQEFGDKHKMVPSIDFNPNTLLAFNYIVSCALFKKADFNKAGGYDEKLMGSYEDWDLWIKFAKLGFKGFRIAEPLFHYRKLGTGAYIDTIKNDNFKKAAIIFNHKELYKEEYIIWAKGIVDGNSNFSNMKTPEAAMPDFKSVRSLINENNNIMLKNEGITDMIKHIKDLMSKNKIKEAKDQIIKELESNSNAQLYSLFAMVYNLEDNQEMAMQMFSKAYEIDPLDYDVVMNIASFLISIGNTLEASQLMEVYRNNKFKSEKKQSSSVFEYTSILEDSLQQPENDTNKESEDDDFDYSFILDEDFKHELAAQKTAVTEDVQIENDQQNEDDDYDYLSEVLLGEKQSIPSLKSEEILPEITEEKPEISEEKFSLNIPASKPKLLFTMYGWNETGGGTTFPKAFTQALARRGYETAVFYAAARHSSETRPYYMEKTIDESGAILYGVYNRPTVFLDAEYPDREIYDDNTVKLFENVINEFKPDVINFHNFLGLSFGIVSSAKKAGIPTTYTPYNYHLIDPRLYLYNSDLSLWKSLDFFENSELATRYPNLSDSYHKRTAICKKLLNEDIDYTFAVSSRVKEILSNFSDSAKKISIINQVHETINSLPEISAEITVKQPFKFAFIGGVMPHKGVHLIAQAAQMLPAGSAEFNIYGFVSREYAEFIKTIDRNGSIHLHGEYSANDLQKIAAENYAAIIPSIWEDCAPFVLTECLAMKLPVIASLIGGVEDFINDGVNGMLYQYDSPQALASVLNSLINNPFKINKMRKNCRINYGFDDYVNFMENIYQNISNNKSLSSKEINLYFNKQ